MSDLSSQILQYLSARPSLAFKSSDLAIAVIGTQGKAKDVNPTLYHLQNEGKVSSTLVGFDPSPYWRIAQHLQTIPEDKVMKTFTPSLPEMMHVNLGTINSPSLPEMTLITSGAKGDIYNPPSISTSGIVVPTPQSATAFNNKDASVEKAVLDYLKETALPTPPLMISKAIFGKDATSAMINPTLYRLKREGKINVQANKNGGNPAWSLNS